MIKNPKMATKGAITTFMIAVAMAVGIPVQAETPKPINDEIHSEFGKVSIIYRGWAAQMGKGDARGKQADGSVWWAASNRPGGMFDTGREHPHHWLDKKCKAVNGSLNLVLPATSPHPSVTIKDPETQGELIITDRMLFRWGTVVQTETEIHDQAPKYNDPTGHFGLFSCISSTGQPLWHVAVMPAMETFQNEFRMATVVDTGPYTLLSLRTVDAKTVKTIADILVSEDRRIAAMQAADREAEVRRSTAAAARAQIATERQHAFQRTLAIGMETNCGLIIGLNGPLVEIQTPKYVTLPNGSTRAFVKRNQIDVPTGEACHFN